MLKIRLRTAVIAGGAIAMLTAPVALGAGEGGDVNGGRRNPSADARKEYTKETEIIANVSTYGTRQSNKSDNGGGAIYGCRSKAGGSAAHNEPCVRAVNLADGFAFEFQTDGVVGGLLTVGKGGDGTKPFTTNATGVATGLNADRVDGKNGDDLMLKTDKATDADKLDGKDSTDFAQAGDLLFAAVQADGDVTASRGGDVTVAGPQGDNTFTLTFAKDVSKCSYTVTENSTTATPGVELSAASSGGRVVVVDQAPAAPGDPAVPFHIQVIC